MINWRSLVLAALPAISDRRGLALTLLLSACTVLCLVPAWQGCWAPLATLLTSYHSYPFGAVLVALPLASLAAEGGTSRLTRGTILATILLPSGVNLVVGTLAPALAMRLQWVFSFLLVGCFGVVLLDLRANGGGTCATSEPDPAKAQPAVLPD